jgi:hypothetical protein
MSVPKVDEVTIAGDFQRFCDACFAQLPDEGKPADPYLYSSHAGAFVRALDQAKDHWVKAKLSFYGGACRHFLINDGVAFFASRCVHSLGIRVGVAAVRSGVRHGVSLVHGERHGWRGGRKETQCRRSVNSMWVLRMISSASERENVSTTHVQDTRRRRAR